MSSWELKRKVVEAKRADAMAAALAKAADKAERLALKAKVHAFRRASNQSKRIQPKRHQPRVSVPKLATHEDKVVYPSVRSGKPNERPIVFLRIASGKAASTCAGSNAASVEDTPSRLGAKESVSCDAANPPQPRQRLAIRPTARATHVSDLDSVLREEEAFEYERIRALAKTKGTEARAVLESTHTSEREGVLRRIMSVVGADSVGGCNT